MFAEKSWDDIFIYLKSSVDDVTLLKKSEHYSV
jgi:hypothetical protein